MTLHIPSNSGVIAQGMISSLKFSYFNALIIFNCFILFEVKRYRKIAFQKYQNFCKEILYSKIKTNETIKVQVYFDLFGAIFHWNEIAF